MVEIEKQEIDDYLFKMALHGVPKKDIDKLRDKFEREIGKEEKPKDIRIPMSEFRKLGLGIGKRTSTRVVREKK